jgi:DNA processing protein
LPVGTPLPDELVPRLLSLALPAAARAWLERPDNHLIDTDLLWIEDNGSQIMRGVDADFPPTLARWNGAPATLYVSGNARSLGAPQLAIVGSRQAPPGGLHSAREFAQQLAGSGIAIASGLAPGISAAAHQGALDAGGVSIAVCVAGLDRVYPERHAQLAERIRLEGRWGVYLRPAPRPGATTLRCAAGCSAPYAPGCSWSKRRPATARRSAPIRPGG